jgi:hypothetical protein
MDLVVVTLSIHPFLHVLLIPELLFKLLAFSASYTMNISRFVILEV